MKIAKRIDISGQQLDGSASLSAILLVDVVKGTSGWLLQIKKDEEIVRVEASASTVLALMKAQREFEANTTGFYEVTNK